MEFTIEQPLLGSDTNGIEVLIPPSVVRMRKHIDVCMNSISMLNPSREVSLVYTALQRAFSWLGESLKADGTPSPYVNSENPANNTIEPRADETGQSLSERWKSIERTQTARVKDFRAIIQQLLDNFGFIHDVPFTTGLTWRSLYVHKSFLELKEAKMWLGWELGRIKIAKEHKFAHGERVEIPL